MTSRTMDDQVIGGLALVGLLVSFTVHAATYFNVSLIERMPFIWVLHLAALLLGAAYLKAMTKDFGR